MLSEWLQYHWFFYFEFLKWYFSKYWQVWTRQFFAQTVTYCNGIVLQRQHNYCWYLWLCHTHNLIELFFLTFKLIARQTTIRSLHALAIAFTCFLSLSPFSSQTRFYSYVTSLEISSDACFHIIQYFNLIAD